MSKNKPSDLLNLGPKSDVWLEAIGIRTRQDVIDEGVESVYLRLYEHFGGAPNGTPMSTVMLYALEGAITDTHWNAIPKQRKEELQAFASQVKEGGLSWE